MRENEDIEFGGVDIIGEFVDAENKEIARRHADLQRKNQVLQLLADFPFFFPGVLRQQPTHQVQHQLHLGLVPTQLRPLGGGKLW